MLFENRYDDALFEKYQVLNEACDKDEIKYNDSDLIPEMPYGEDLEHPYPNGDELESFAKKIVKGGDKIEIYYQFGKNGMGLTKELEIIGKEIEDLSNEYHIYLNNKPHFDTLDDVYDFKIYGEKRDKERVNEDVKYIRHRMNEVKNILLGMKRIYLTEAQKKYIKENIDSYFVDPNKVLMVKNFLDKTFVRAKMPIIGQDGMPNVKCIVGMKGADGKVAKNMYAEQLFYLLQDKFRGIYGDKNKRDKFLKQVMIDWYNKKITIDGLLSVNKY